MADPFWRHFNPNEAPLQTDENLALANSFGGMAIVRGRRLAVEHVLGMLVAWHTNESMLEDFPWLEREDIQACLLYAKRTVGNERIEPVLKLSFCVFILPRR